MAGIKHWYLMVVLFTILTTGSYGKLLAQCDFSVSAAMQKESDCQSNGVVLVTLSGVDVDNGNVELHDAKFGIESTATGGFVLTPTANGGVIGNVPPGTYKITVQAFCRKANSWVVKIFSPVTVTGSYTVPNINKVYVVSADIQKSLKCEPTGVIPINVEGGRPPYTITISAAPLGYAGPTTFTRPTEGVIAIPDLPAGSYAFSISDACTYTLYGIKATVGEVQPSYAVGTVTPVVCATGGVIPITVKDGAAPYTVEMVAKPAAYTGAETFTIAADGTLNITDLPAGTYTFNVKDKCHEETLTASVNKLTFSVSQGAVTGTTTCDASGSVSIAIEGGQAPYTVAITSAPPCFALPWSQTYPASGTEVIGGLCEGVYTIEVKDDCGTTEVLSGITVAAVHMEVNLKSEKLATACCAADGEQIIEIEGGKEPYKVSLVSADTPYYINPGAQKVSNAGNYTISGLAPGTYIFEIEDECREIRQVLFTIGYKPMTVTVKALLGSLECLATGGLQLSIKNGKPPYKIEMVSYPPAYTGQTTFTTVAGTYTIGSLLEGAYTLTVTDACGEAVKAAGVIADLPAEFPFDFYYDYFLPPSSIDRTCKKVRIRRNINISGSLGSLWNSNPGDYYEVAFREDTDPFIVEGTLSWRPLNTSRDTTLTLSRTYCQLREQNGYVVAYLRVKNDVTFLCNVATDTIRMADLEVKLGTPYNQSCTGYSIKLEHYTDQRGLFCYPYTWKLLPLGSSTPIKTSGAPINTSASQTVTDIPYGDYVFELTDSEGCSWYSDAFSYHWSPSPTVALATKRDCGTYTAVFTIEDLCPPFDWYVTNRSNVTIAGKTNVMVTGVSEEVPGLQYGDSYRLKVVYGGGKDTTILIKETATLHHNYQISFEPYYCLPDTGQGAIFIHRDSTMPSFEKGSIIAFISGPTTPLHTLIPIETDSTGKVFPFSTDPLAYSFQPILPGQYEFTLTDTCGIVHSLIIRYEVATLAGLGYTKDETCEGIKVYPEGTIYLGNIPQPTYFRISAAPTGIAIDPNSVAPPSYLFLPESGTYEIQVSAEDSPTSCPFDKFLIEYTKRSVSLDADSTEAYVCEAGSVGFIKIVRKDGIGPFEYELFDQGVSVGKNATGKFSHGSPGNTYTICIRDKGCKVSFEQNITVVNLANERLIYGATGYCPGNVIELNSLSVNTNGYSWEGPNGFTSTDQHPRIPNADSTNQGVYTLSIQPEGCTGPIKQAIEVSDFKPEVPMASPVNIVCLNAKASPLSATVSSADNVLKWYDRNGITPLSSAPVPSTAAVDTVTYYVSQVNTVWGCEGDKIPVQAAISDVPAINLLAEAPAVCPGMIPTIVLPQTHAGYTYSLYNAQSGGNLLGVGYSLGDTVKIRSSMSVMSSATFYVEVIDRNACISPDRKVVTVSTENYLEIKPDVIPEYKRGKPYEVQLQSNAVEPAAYSTASGLPPGFTLSTSGLITGNAPSNGYIDAKSFDVRLVDANGCAATKLYKLKSEPFIPNTFTPDGDGYNDVFMKGHHLIIFDRLGVVIFEGNDGWDGRRNNGKKAPPDTYFYILDYRHEDSTISKRKGYITVLER